MKFPLDSQCDTIDLTFHVKGAGEWMVISILIQIYYKILILLCHAWSRVLMMYQFPINMEMFHDFLVGTTHMGLAPKDPVVAKRMLMSLIRARPEVGGREGVWWVENGHAASSFPSHLLHSRRWCIKSGTETNYNHSLSSWMNGYFFLFEGGLNRLPAVQCPNANLGDFPTWWADVTCNPPPWSGKWQGKIHCWFEAVSIHIGKVEKLTFVSFI